MRIFKIITVFLLIAGCSNNDYEMNDFYKMYGNGTDDVGALIEEVSNLKVYFGHQSVGCNIMEGIYVWEQETGVYLKAVESRDFKAVSDASFVHFRIGKNGDFRGKVDDFVSLVTQIPDGENPIAFFKFCFVDITSESDVDSEFEYYNEKMLYLKDNYPNIKFVVCTVPVTGVQKGIRAAAKRILNRTPYGYLDNIKRQEFNERIISDFSGIMSVFDLAGLEATHPDGSIETYSCDGDDYPCMPDYYRTDYGHLNSFGARTISYNLLAFLVEEQE